MLAQQTRRPSNLPIMLEFASTRHNRSTYQYRTRQKRLGRQLRWSQFVIIALCTMEGRKLRALATCLHFCRCQWMRLIVFGPERKVTGEAELFESFRFTSTDCCEPRTIGPPNLQVTEVNDLQVVSVQATLGAVCYKRCTETVSETQTPMLNPAGFVQILRTHYSSSCVTALFGSHPASEPTAHTDLPQARCLRSVSVWKQLTSLKLFSQAPHHG